MSEKYAGIDVSTYQKTIDFNAVKTGKFKGVPITFAMIRLSVNRSIDTRAIDNINNALKAGLNVGVYHYSYAKTPDDAKAEAELVLKTIKNNGFDGKLTLPVAFDIEEGSILRLGKDKCTAIAKAFMDTIAAANYQPMIYTYAAAYNSKFDANALKDYPLWIAGYISENALRNKFGVKNYVMWQFGIAGDSRYDIECIGKVPGVKGKCDCDYLYEDLPAKIKAEGKNGFSARNSESYTVTIEDIPSKALAEELLAEAKAKVEGCSGFITEPENPKPKSELKPIEEVAREVIRGDWGNGAERKKRLAAAGYDPAEVQRMVDRLLKK